MSKFRKKPVVIEAVQLENSKEGFAAVLRLCPQAGLYPDNTVSIKTPDGFITAAIGDWIIKSVRGSFYIYKPDIFEATYEAVK